jgi:alpha-1,2-mannosyltransferase
MLERNPSLALRYAVAIGCLVMTVIFFHRMVCGSSVTPPWSRLLIGVGAGALTLQFILNDLDDGGPHLMLLGIIAGAIYAIWVGREWLGAALMGFSIVLKITPALFVLLFLWKRQWRLASYTVLATVLWILLPILYMGPTSWWDHHMEWTRNAVLSVLDRQVEGRQENELQKANLSLRHTMLRYKPVLDLPGPLANAIVWVAVIGIVGLFAWSSRRTFQGPGDSEWGRECAGVLLLALFLSPITWDQHLVWMIPAACIVVAAATKMSGALSRTGYTMLAVYVVLTMVLNYEVVGRVRWEALKSYHHLGFAMLILYGLLLSTKDRGISSKLRAEPILPSSPRIASEI